MSDTAPVSRAAAILALASLLLGSPVLLPAPLEAQEPGEEPAELEELIVTAYRVPVSRDALTGSVTVITRDEVESSGADHVAELLRSTPGAAVVATGSWGEPTSLFLRGGESNYVKVLIDGVPANRPGGDFDFSTLTTDAVDRIEIVRGPASVLYGSDAVSGVVQIFTRGGDGPPAASAHVKGGSHGTLEWGGRYAGGRENVSYGFSLSRFATDGIRAFNNDYLNTTASARVRLRPDARTDASLSVRYSDVEAHSPTNSAGEPVDRNQFRFEDALTLGLEVAHELTRDLDLTLSLSTRESDGGFDDAPDGPADTLGLFTFQSQDHVTRRGAELRLDFQPVPATVLTAGAALESESGRTASRGESPFGGFSSSQKMERGSRGTYLQALTGLDRPYTLNGGLRLEDNETFGRFLTYRAGAAYAFPGGTRLQASVGTGFREPTFVENFAEGGISGNPDLDPERTLTWEVGARQSLAAGRVTLSASWFDQRFEDLIQFTFTPPDPEDPNFFNIGGAEARGLELGVDADLTERLLAGAGYTRLETEVTDAGFDSGPDATFVEGERLLRRPTHAGHVTLGLRVDGGGTARITVHHTGERTDRDFSVSPAERVELPAYTRVDVSARRPVEGPGGWPAFTPTLRIENLFDAEIEEIANFPARGRTIFVGAEITSR